MPVHLQGELRCIFLIWLLRGCFLCVRPTPRADYANRPPKRQEFRQKARCGGLLAQPWYIYIYPPPCPQGTSGVSLRTCRSAGLRVSILQAAGLLVCILQFFKGTPPPSSRMACVTRMTFFHTFFDAVFQMPF